MPPRDIGDGHAIAAGLQNDRRLYMLWPSPTTCRTRNDIDTPAISFAATVKTSVCLYIVAM